MLDDLDRAASRHGAMAAPPKPEVRRIVEAFPSVPLAFDVASDPEREKPLLTPEVVAQVRVPA